MTRFLLPLVLGVALAVASTVLAAEDEEPDLCHDGLASGTLVACADAPAPCGGSSATANVSAGHGDVADYRSSFCVGEGSTCNLSSKSLVVFEISVLSNYECTDEDSTNVHFWQEAFWQAPPPLASGCAGLGGGASATPSGAGQVWVADVPACPS